MEHLRDALALLYPVTTDWSDIIFLGLTLEWDYPNRIFYLSIPRYVTAALHKFQH